MSRRRPAAFLGLLVLAGLLSGCTVQPVLRKGYQGPDREFTEVGIVIPGSIEGMQNQSVAILAVDGQSELEQWRSGSLDSFYLLPGVHRFRLEMKQSTQGTGLLLADLVILAADAASAAIHGEVDVEFPVQPGMSHRVHYDPDRKVFSVSVRPQARDSTVRSPLFPTSDAVECAARSDRGAAFWCDVLGAERE